MQNEDEDLKPFAEKKEAVKRGEYEVKFKKYRGILYRIRHRSDGLGETKKQIMVPKSLRQRVMVVVHDSMFGDHLGTKRQKIGSKPTFIGRKCIRTSLASADLVMYVKRNFWKLALSNLW